MAEASGARGVTRADMERARIPRRYWDVKLSAVLDSMPYKQPFKTYLRDIDSLINKGIGLYLYSTEPSTGKTSLAVLALKRAMEMRHTVLFVRLPEFRLDVFGKEQFDEDSTVLDRARKVDLLVMDEVNSGSAMDGKYIGNIVLELVQHRSQHMLPTIITTDIPPGSVSTEFSPYMVGLMQESFIPLDIVGESAGGMNWRAFKSAELQGLLGEES